jgi:hypothetical protein
MLLIATNVSADPSTDICYGQLSGLAWDEGKLIDSLQASSIEECQDKCTSQPGCHSISYHPTMSYSCQLMEKVITDVMPTNGGQCSRSKDDRDCRTYFQKPCGDNTYGVPTDEILLSYDDPNVTGNPNMQHNPCWDERFSEHAYICPDWIYLEPDCHYLPTGDDQADYKATTTSSLNLTEVFTMAYDMGAMAFTISYHDWQGETFDQRDGNTVFRSSVYSMAGCDVPSKCIHWQTVDCTPRKKSNFLAQRSEPTANALGRPGFYIRASTAQDGIWMSDRDRQELIGQVRAQMGACQATFGRALEDADWEKYFDHLDKEKKRKMITSWIVSGVTFVLSLIPGGVGAEGGLLVLFDVGSLARRLAKPDVSNFIRNIPKLGPRFGDKVVNYLARMADDKDKQSSIKSSIDHALSAAVSGTSKSAQVQTLEDRSADDALHELYTSSLTELSIKLPDMPNSMLWALRLQFDKGANVEESDCSVDGQKKRIRALTNILQGLQNLGKHECQYHGGGHGTSYWSETIYGLCHFHNSDDDHGYKFCTGERGCKSRDCADSFRYKCEYDGFVIPEDQKASVLKMAQDNKDDGICSVLPPIDSVDFGDVHCS